MEYPHGVELFTEVTETPRGRRAAVVVYAAMLASLAALGDFLLLPYGARTGLQGKLALVVPGGTVVVGIVALVVVVQVLRGRMDRRLGRLSVLLVLANLAILALYVVLSWDFLRGVIRL